MALLRVVPLDDTVVFPGMPVTLPADVGSDARVFLIPQRGTGYAKVGVVAEVSERVALGGRRVVSFMPLHRGVPGVAQTGADGVLRLEVEERPDPTPPAEPDARARARVPRGGGGDSRAPRRRWPDQCLRPLHHPAGRPGGHAGYSPDLNLEQKLELLETLDVVERLTLALRLQQDRLAELRVRKRIREEVESGAQKQQREYLLRRQMDAIRKELGENEGSVAEEYRTKIAAAGMPEPVQKQAERELGALRAHGRVERRGIDDPDLSGLAARRSLVEAIGGAPGSPARARGPGRRSRRPRRREAAHHRVPGRPEAARGARTRRTIGGRAPS